MTIHNNNIRKFLAPSRALALCGIVLTFVLIVAAPGVASATTCPGTGAGVTHWWGLAQASLGAGTAEGSYITEPMPTTYFSASNASNDEATWVINTTWVGANQAGNDASNGSFEVGWFQGTWPYSPSYPFYHEPHAYETTFGATVGLILNTSDLPFNGNNLRFLIEYVDTSCPTTTVYDLTTSVYYYQTNTCFGNNSIVIPTPRFVQSQGEVSTVSSGGNGGTWMGGNSGNGLLTKAYYQSFSDNNFYAWGSVNATCNNLPYWITVAGSNSLKNGGT
jgi:hypothetical protein